MMTPSRFATKYNQTQIQGNAFRMAEAAREDTASAYCDSGGVPVGHHTGLRRDRRNRLQERFQFQPRCGMRHCRPRAQKLAVEIIHRSKTPEKHFSKCDAVGKSAYLL